jgi:hypothetical protein
VPATNTPTRTPTSAAPTNTPTRTTTATVGPLGSVTPLSVGGVEFLEIGGGADSPNGPGSGSGGLSTFVLFLISAAVLPILGAGGWYARRRRLAR